MKSTLKSVMTNAGLKSGTSYKLTPTFKAAKIAMAGATIGSIGYCYGQSKFNLNKLTFGLVNKKILGSDSFESMMKNTAQADSIQDMIDPYARSRANKPLNNAQDVVLITGNSNRALAEGVSKRLSTKLADGRFIKFADNECYVEIN